MTFNSISKSNNYKHFLNYVICKLYKHTVKLKQYFSNNSSFNFILTLHRITSILISINIVSESEIISLISNSNMVLYLSTTLVKLQFHKVSFVCCIFMRRCRTIHCSITRMIQVLRFHH